MKVGLMYCSLTRRLIEVAVVFAVFAFTISAFAQTLVLSGTCTGEDGKPLVGYTIQIKRQVTNRTVTTKTNKRGQYMYVGLDAGTYDITLMDPDGNRIFTIQQPFFLGEAGTFINFDMAKEKAASQKEQMAIPETAKRIDEQQKEQKQFGGLKEPLEQASLLFEQQRYSEAAAAYEHALPLAKDKNLPTVLGRLGDCYVNAAALEHNRDARIQDQQKALDYYQKAIRAKPTEAWFHNNLGSLYAEMGKIDNAQAEFHKAADLNPAGASGYYYNMGVVMVNQGKMDEAAVSLKKATDLDPANASAFYWYGMALLGKAETKADGTIVPVPGTVEAFQNYLKLDPYGAWAQAAHASLDQLKAMSKATKKKKS